jgi:hypothetical protein
MPGAWHTLDFTLQSRTCGDCFVAELKCELEYEGYKYLRLDRSQQLDHHVGNAFKAFLAFASDPQATDVTVAGKRVSPAGAILVWGAVSNDGVMATKRTFGFHDVLSVETMISDLRRWESDVWKQRVDELRGWAGELFDYLA